MRTEHHEPIIYRLYDWLKNYHYGEQNGILRADAAKAFGVSERDFRRLTREINESTELEKLVSTRRCCYMCATREECERSIRATYNTAAALLKKAKRMEKKVGLNGQMKIKLGDYYKDVVETFTKE